MHSKSDTSLHGATDVVSVPGRTHGDTGEDTEENEEASEILDGVLGNCNQNDEAGDTTFGSVHSQRQ